MTERERERSPVLPPKRYPDALAGSPVQQLDTTEPYSMYAEDLVLQVLEEALIKTGVRPQDGKTRLGKPLQWESTGPNLVPKYGNKLLCGFDVLGVHYLRKVFAK